MHEQYFIVRESLLDPKQRVIGFELTWQQADTDQHGLTAETCSALIDYAGQQLSHDEQGWLLPDNLLFFRATPELVSSSALDHLPPKNIVLTVLACDLADPVMLSALNTLKAKGFGIALRDADVLGADKALLPVATYVETGFGPADLPAQAKIYAALKQSPVKMLARDVSTWEDYDSCASLGVNAFVGNLYLTTRPGSKPAGLNPAQAIILQLMEMVRQNADVRQLEGVLKRDAALSYKLFRYINSAGFGLGTEIQSLRHAVTMLGYSPLYRWLSVLLATATTAGYSPVLMQTAIIRGRFAELLGKGFIPKGEAENLFVAGMFSLLDRLLGISMEEVLENIQLSDAVSQALLSREGMYGPFLALAEACEFNNGEIAERAEALFISPEQVNEAHLAALAWAQSLKI